MSKQLTKTISLRLPIALVEELERRGLPEHCSAGELARRYVHDRLAEGTSNELMAAIEGMDRRFASLEEKMIIAMTTLLVDAGKATVEEAEEWAAENLR